MKKWIITLSSLMLSVSLGMGAALYVNADIQEDTHHHSEGLRVQNQNLQQELYHVDLIVRGVVEDQQLTYQQDAGLKGKANFFFDVTPITIRVDDVLYGQAPSGGTINLLQHGTASDVLVQKGEEVILLLNQTSWGDYWSYDFDNGIWKIENGKVVSEATSPLLSAFKNVDANVFERSVSSAALQKQLNPTLKASE